MTNPFEHPQTPHARKHGPDGYLNYESYRPWLEDEFWFRCVYCLRRKAWNLLEILQIDHLMPMALHPSLECKYDNLVLACQFCNLAKGKSDTIDPCELAFGQLVTLNPDGFFAALSEEGSQLIDTMRLNHHHQVKQRMRMIRLLGVLEKHDKELFNELMGFPEQLPDLEVLKPKENRRPEGIAQSCLVLRRRGELPLIY